jgi:hypothetical protein
MMLSLFSSEAASLRRAVALASDNFSKLDQSGILAQKFFPQAGIFSAGFISSTIQNLNRAFCQVFKL